MRRLPTSELLRSPPMTSRTCSVLGVAALLLCIPVGCSGKSAPTEKPSPLDPSDLYPLSTGNAWSYDVDTGEASTTLAITRVESFDGRFAQVRTARTIVRYEVQAEGIHVPADEAWLIRAPLREGSKWAARGDRTAELVSLNSAVETPAGAFQSCVEVLERGGRLELEVRTVYCPGVGPALVESTMRSNVSERVLTVTARLRGFAVSPRPVSDR